MNNTLCTLGSAVLGGLAGYLMSTGRMPEGVIAFMVLIVLNVSRLFE